MLELKNITKTFGEVTAIKNLCLMVEDREFFVLLGPTGAGKTTTLRVVAGLEKPDSGKVLYNGEDITCDPPGIRDFAFMFESHNLYPTMNVYDNLAFPLRSPLFRVSEQGIRERIQKIAHDLRITHLLNRRVSALSGGEQQRVALGRALVRKPKIYILDEPLSNLDYKLREELQTEFKRIHEDYGITILCATHDNISAMAMATRIGILYYGHLLQVGNPREIYEDPVSVAVANVIGAPSMNFVKALVGDSENILLGGEIPFRIPRHCFEKLKSYLSGEVLVGIWPENFRIVDESTGIIPCVVKAVEYHGIEKFAHLTFQDFSFVALVSENVSLRRGDTCFLAFDFEKLYFFDPKTEQRVRF